MTVRISPLADVHPQAELGERVEIGPFCLVGPHVRLGDDCRLDSHVTIVGHTAIGPRNRFWPGAVIGGEPQDYCYQDGPTRVEIGADNKFREGVTVHRGADKEDGVTRIGNDCYLMANAHVAHNCRLFDRVMLVNGVLLGGHVHVHEHAIISGNTVVHHFASIGTSGFVSGGCRVVTDIPPFMLAGEEGVVTINLVGMKRRQIPDATIALIKQAHRRLYREHKPLAEVRTQFASELAVFPPELTLLLDFCAATALGKSGRAREAVRNLPPPAMERRAA
jgi:UDP-N-acetylglucosamine acyltransferase